MPGSDQRGQLLACLPNIRRIERTFTEAPLDGDSHSMAVPHQTASTASARKPSARRTVSASVTNNGTKAELS